MVHRHRDLVQDVLRLFDKTAIGFNRIVPSVVEEANITYPPFNVVKLGEGKYRLEVALAGFDREDISVSKGNNFLTIEGKKSESEEVNEYYWKGIASRAFTRKIPISNVEVGDAKMDNGILSINIEDKEAVTKQIPVL